VKGGGGGGGGGGVLFFCSRLKRRIVSLRKKPRPAEKEVHTQRYLSRRPSLAGRRPVVGQPVLAVLQGMKNSRRVQEGTPKEISEKIEPVSWGGKAHRQGREKGVPGILKIEEGKILTSTEEGRPV